MERNPQPLQVIDTQLYADSVEWCPFPGLQDVLVCGTYQLLETSQDQTPPDQPQVRVGQLQVYCLQDQGNGDLCLQQAHCVDMPGILDIKWARQPLRGAVACGLVNAKGQLQLWKMGDCHDSKTAGGKLSAEMSEEKVSSEISEEKVSPETAGGKVSPERLENVDIADCIGLSLDWSAPCDESVPKLVTSDSKGQLSVFEVSSSVTQTTQWHAHDFEAWICAFDQWSPHVVYSGSDDCKLKVWDLRVGPTPMSTNSRFTMGVCSIQSNPLREHLLAVGSYDENVRIFDSRRMKQPVSTTHLGGGVWRVKWDPFTGCQLLTASMHNGFHIIDCSTSDADSLPVLCHYTHHKSLAYGADWCRLDPGTLSHGSSPVTEGDTGDAAGKAQALVSSCSFYDHSLQLWRS